MHEHDFCEHVGVTIAAGTIRVWLPIHKVENIAAFTNVERYPRMLKCQTCGEQGYEIRNAGKSNLAATLDNKIAELKRVVGRRVYD